MTLAPVPVIGSTPDDSLLAALRLSTRPVRYRRGRRRAHTEPWSPNAPQTASENRWRVSARIGPPTSLRSVGRILSRFLGQRALARKRHHLGPPLRRNPLLVIERAPGLPIGHGGAEHPEWASGRSRRVSCTPRHTWEETASERRRCKSRAAV